MEGISYKKLKVNGYEIQSIEQMKIVAKVNEHASLYLTGVLEESVKDKYIDLAYKDKSIEVYSEDEGKTLLFSGVVTNIEINVQGELYKIMVEAKSRSYLLDIEKKSRSFQDISITSHELVQSIMTKYLGSQVITNIPDKNIQELLVQF